MRVIIRRAIRRSTVIRGIISRIVNPYAMLHVICAATTGLGTRVALEFLADPGSSPEFLNKL